MTSSAMAFLQQFVATPALQSAFKSRIYNGHTLEMAVIDTAIAHGYHFTFAQLTAALDATPELADALAALFAPALIALHDARG
jgi:hypothetical protein